MNGTGQGELGDKTGAGPFLSPGWASAGMCGAMGQPTRRPCQVSSCTCTVASGAGSPRNQGTRGGTALSLNGGNSQECSWVGPVHTAFPRLTVPLCTVSQAPLHVSALSAVLVLDPTCLTELLGCPSPVMGTSPPSLRVGSHQDASGKQMSSLCPNCSARGLETAADTRGCAKGHLQVPCHSPASS